MSCNKICHFSHHVLLYVLTEVFFFLCFCAGVLERHQTVQCLKKCCVDLCTVDCSVTKGTMGANGLSGLCGSFFVHSSKLHVRLPCGINVNKTSDF